MNARPRTVVVGAFALLLGAAMPGQDPAPRPAPPAPAPGKQPPAAEAPAADVVRQAEERLRALAATSRDTAVLVADYVQRRTTKLAKEPLESRGQFVFVKQPGCVVFRATAPRESVTRLRGDTYEVYRPQKKQLERFVLEGPELANGLFAALGGDVDALLRDFAIRSTGADAGRPGHVLVVLAPRTPAIAARIGELSLRLVTASNALAAVAYRDAAGDLVEIELVDPKPNPASPPSVEFDLAAGTAVIEHRATKR